MNYSSFLLNDKQLATLKYMFNDQNVLLTGKEETGKQVVIQKYRELADTPNIAYLAPTVTEAFYSQGQTIPGFFQIPDRVLYLDEEPLPVIDKNSTLFYRILEGIIIDGISTLRSDVFYAMDIRLRQAAKDPFYKTRPFADKQIIAVGDLSKKSRLNLGKSEREYLKNTFGGVYAYETPLWDELNFFQVELHEKYQYRWED